MAAAYLSQINFYLEPVEKAISVLESHVVAGTKDGVTLQPAIDDLHKKIEKYNAGVKPVKAAYASWLEVECFVSG